jgi:hypothetical protein
VEQQLATTQAELQELKERQHQLELLLEKTQICQDENLQDKVSCSVSESWYIMDCCKASIKLHAHLMCSATCQAHDLPCTCQVMLKFWACVVHNVCNGAGMQ